MIRVKWTSFEQCDQFLPDEPTVEPELAKIRHQVVSPLTDGIDLFTWQLSAFIAPLTSSFSSSYCRQYKRFPTNSKPSTKQTMVLKATLNGLLLFWLMISTQLISTLTTARFIYNIPSDTKSLSDRTFEKRLPTQLYFDPLGGMALGKRAGPSVISGQYFDPLAGMAFGKRAGLVRPTWNAGYPEPAY
ncbi:hypothetical protein T4D_5784 [Trichinella pseudospiralis]|uniref:Uncharacterized protein n=1 Tax=Trichinella pseudospiralis TaxID=6337 RepID=A0A0V1FZY3_TRIPS|nr:hypothetical protein T4D_5784 [Trichinella pseudospiralis]